MTSLRPRGTACQALKLVANAGSYGIYSEFNARERRKGVTTTVRSMAGTRRYRPGRSPRGPWAILLPSVCRLHHRGRQAHVGHGREMRG